MKIAVAALSAVLTLATAGLPALAATKQRAGGPQELSLDTDFGPLTLTLDLDARTVTGVYPKFQGRLVGTVSEDGQSITAIWLQPKGDQTCARVTLGTRFWGNVVFTYPYQPMPGDRLGGRWGYCDAPPAEPWNGVFR